MEKISYLLFTEEEGGKIYNAPENTILNKFTDPIELKEYLISNEKIDFEYFSIFMVNELHKIINIYDSNTKKFRNAIEREFERKVPEIYQNKLKHK